MHVQEILIKLYIFQRPVQIQCRICHFVDTNTAYYKFFLGKTEVNYTFDLIDFSFCEINTCPILSFQVIKNHTGGQGLKVGNRAEGQTRRWSYEGERDRHEDTQKSLWTGSKKGIHVYLTFDSNAEM